MTANPYNPLQPNPACFFGREDVFAFLRQHLVGTALDRALVLVGRRGLGKSAVLVQLEQQIEARYRPCLLTLGAESFDNEAELLALLVAAIRRTLEEAEASTYRVPDWPGMDAVDDAGQPVDLRAWFRDEFLDVALSALRQRHLLLALDDAHLLLDAVEAGALPADFWDYVGSLLAGYERCDLLVTLDAAYENRAQHIDLFSDPALQFRLHELSRPTAEQLVREPMEAYVVYEGGLVDRVLAWGGGHPFLLQVMCYMLFRRSEERSHHGTLSNADLEAASDAILEQTDEVFAPLWARASHNERLALTAVVRLSEALPGETLPHTAIHTWLSTAGYDINSTQLAAALRALDYEGLVRAGTDDFTLPAGLIAAWVSANTSSEVNRAPRSPLDWARVLRVTALVLVIALAGGAGIAALGGVFDGGDDDPAQPGTPTATLSLNIEATRRADFLTQTERARPTETPTITPTPTASPTPTITLTPTSTATPTNTVTPTITLTPTLAPTLTATATLRPMRTPRPSRTPIELPPTQTVAPTSSPLPTLDPGD